MSPLAYMRGRTFHDTFVIADEMQNSSPTQMLMMGTRMGLGSKLVITGDLNQTDRKLEIDGLSDFIHKWKAYKEHHYAKLNETTTTTTTDTIQLVELLNVDIVRSPMVTQILDIYNFVSIKNGRGGGGDSGIRGGSAQKPIGTNGNGGGNRPPRTTTINGNNDAALIPFDQYYFML